MNIVKFTASTASGFSLEEALAGNLFARRHRDTEDTEGNAWFVGCALPLCLYPSALAISARAMF